MANTPSIVGIIPARFASTRFPAKMLAPLCGRPLIAWVVERVGQASALDEVIVATDDQRIADAVQEAGAKAVMTRADHPSGTDRVAEAAATSGADIVINVQGDEPLIDPDLIDKLGSVLRDDASWDMATAATPLRDPADLASPNVVKVVTGKDRSALYFSRAPIPFDRDGTHEVGGDRSIYRRHIGMYGYRREFLERLVQEPPCVLEEVEKLEQLRALHLGCRMCVIETEDTGIGVDTPEDLKRVEAILKAREGQ